MRQPLIYQTIRRFHRLKGMSKSDSIVQGIIASIQGNDLKSGDQLPSVRTLILEFGFARKTILKAYNELKERGVVKSMNRIGYFVDDANSKAFLKIFLLMYAFGDVQRIFYNAFKLSLGSNIRVDTFFHHNNGHVFESIISQNFGNYGVYVIAPIQNKESSKILELIPDNSLLLIDRYHELGKCKSFVTQDFEDATYTNLKEHHVLLSKFDRFVLFYREDLDYPKGTLNGFLKYVKKFNLPYEVQNMYMPGALHLGTYIIQSMIRICGNCLMIAKK